MHYQVIIIIICIITTNWGDHCMYVCICKKITDTQILQEVERGASSINEISAKLGVATQCGKCKNCAKKMIKRGVADRQYFPIDMLTA